MQIFVMTLVGATHTIDVDPDDTIESVLDKLQERCGQWPCMGRLFHAVTAKALADTSRTLSDYEIGDQTTLHHTHSSRGCGKCGNCTDPRN